MKEQRLKLVSAFLMPLLAYSTTIEDPGTYFILDRIATVAGSGSVGNRLALEILKEIAIGDRVDIPFSLMKAIGLAEDRPAMPQGAFIKEGSRIYAFQKLGEIGVDEAMAFLENLKKIDIGAKAPISIWNSSQIALANIRASRMAENQAKIKFLETFLASNLPETNWAMDRLCDLGAIQSIPRISSVMSASWAEAYAQEEVRFCKARIEAVSSNSDRVEALGSVLTIDQSDRRLIEWAAMGLIEINSPAALGKIERFREEVRSTASVTNFRHLNTLRSLDARLEKRQQLELLRQKNTRR